MEDRISRLLPTTGTSKLPKLEFCFFLIFFSLAFRIHSPCSSTDQFYLELWVLYFSPFLHTAEFVDYIWKIA